MQASSFFRDIQMPSHASDRAAHERFLLDTYADRRDPGEQAGMMSRLLAKLRK